MLSATAKRISIFFALATFALNSFSQEIGLSDVKSWAYQLENIDIDEISNSGYDLLVIDHSWDGTEFYNFTKNQVDHIKKRPDGKNRIVCSFLSIGAAQKFRGYWHNSYKKHPPAWLNIQKEVADETYDVRYWEPGWKNIMFHQINHIIHHGFDGIYLGNISFVADSGVDRKNELIQFIKEIRQHVNKKAHRKFYLIIENNEVLVSNDDFLESIDGIARENFNYRNNGADQSSEFINQEVKNLTHAKSKGKLILTVDYVDDSLRVDHTYTESHKNGFIPYASVSSLDQLIVHKGYDPLIKFHIHHEHNNRITPGQFYNIVIPQGLWRIKASSEYSNENFGYSRTISNTTHEFESPKYSSWTTSASISSAINKSTEIGITLPFVRYNATPDATDMWQTSDEPFNNLNLGNVVFEMYNGHSWNQYNDNLLFECLVEIPTDTRKGIFNPGLTQRLSGSFEHYWGAFGVSSLAAINFASDNKYDNWSSESEFKLGYGLQLNNRLFTSGNFGYEGKTMVGEIAIEFLQAHYTSIEFYTGKSFSNTTDRFYFGISINHMRERSFQRIWW